LCAGSGPRAWLQTLVWPRAHRSSVKTQFSWLLHPNPVLLAPVTGPSALRSGVRTRAKGSCVKNHFSWVIFKYSYPDPTTLSATTDPNYNPLGFGHERSPPSWARTQTQMLWVRTQTQPPTSLGLEHDGPKPQPVWVWIWTQPIPQPSWVRIQTQPPNHLVSTANPICNPLGFDHVPNPLGTPPDPTPKPHAEPKP